MRIDDEGLRLTSRKRAQLYQQLQASNINQSGGNSPTIAQVFGKMAGRSFNQIERSGSKEQNIFQNYLNNTQEDGFLVNYVNTVKKHN